MQFYSTFVDMIFTDIFPSNSPDIFAHRHGCNDLLYSLLLLLFLITIELCFELKDLPCTQETEIGLKT